MEDLEQRLILHGSYNDCEYKPVGSPVVLLDDARKGTFSTVLALMLAHSFFLS